MRRCLQVLLVGVLGCRPTTTESPEPATPVAAAASSPLRFAWPAGAHAIVTERVLKKGRHATMKYRIVTQHDGPTILVYYRDFAFVEIEGIDLADPEARQQIEALERQVAGAIPPYRIAADGTWLGCGEIDTLLDGLAGILPAADIATFRQMMTNPRIRAVIEAKLREVWQAWAEGWLGFDLGVGERLEGSNTIEIGGTSAVLPYVVERLAGDDATIHLRATSELGGDTAKAMVGALLDEVIATLPDHGSKGAAMSAAARKVDVRRIHLREAALDRATMLPTRAFSRVTIVIGDGQATTESIESHEWLFEWQPAS